MLTHSTSNTGTLVNPNYSNNLYVILICSRFLGCLVNNTKTLFMMIIIIMMVNGDDGKGTFRSFKKLGTGRYERNGFSLARN